MIENLLKNSDEFRQIVSDLTKKIASQTLVSFDLQLIFRKLATYAVNQFDIENELIKKYQIAPDFASDLQKSQEYFLAQITQICEDVSLNLWRARSLLFFLISWLDSHEIAQNSLLIGSVANIVQGTISKIDEIVRGNSNPNADIIEICNAYETNNVKFRLDLIAPTSSVTSIFSGSNLTTPALYALVNLNPFIVSGVNSNAYAELEKYKAEYSENYVSDKAKMFKALMDTPKVGSYYDDYETGKKISYYTSVTDPDSTDEYNLTDTAYTFGTNKNDIVTASVGKANRIYTLAGDDTITLTSGSDYIEAGCGSCLQGSEGN